MRSRRSPSGRTRRAAGCARRSECGLRTPFQRDRDRILHSKPFRRLKGKTQVFIDPAGDHYRTRMTHTLETTAIARGVARALRLNEDLTEAIGLGHDTGHPPFGHAGEEALDECMRERFGRGFRHNEQSLRIAEQLNLTAEVRDGILNHTGDGEPATLEGRIVRIVDRVAYINHDIDDAIRFGILRPDELPAGRDRGARADRVDADRHARARPGRDLGPRRRHRAERDEVGAAMLVAARRSCSSASTSARTRGAEHERARRSCGGSSSTSSGAATRVGGRGRLPRRHDRPLRPRLRGDARLMARIKDDSVEAVKAAANIVDARRGAHAAAQGRRPLHGALPVPRRADAVLLGLARPRHLPLLRLRRRRRRDLVRPETEGLDFVGAIEWLARPLPRAARVRGGVAAGRRGAPAPRPAPRAARAGGRVLRALPLGVAARARPRASTSRRAALGEAVCREFRLGLSPERAALVREGAGAGVRADELAAAGLVDAPRHRLLPAAG